MRIQYCWRARREMPMLEDHEVQHIYDVWAASGENPDLAFATLSAEAQKLRCAPLTPAPVDAPSRVLRLWHLCAGYELFTGTPLGHPNYFYPLCTSWYGPPCPHCGKPLRTSQARFCAECGAPTPAAAGTALRRLVTDG